MIKQDIVQLLTDVEEFIESGCAGYEKWQIVAGTASATVAYMYLHYLISHRRDVTEDVKQWVFKMIRSIPRVRREIDSKLATVREDMEKDYYAQGSKDTLPLTTRLPEKGWDQEKINDVAQKIINLGRYDWKGGKISGGAFSGSNNNYTDMMVKLYHMTAWANPLHADVFPGIRKMEAEIIQITIGLFHGNKDVVGALTSGGSESLLMMTKAYRDRAKKRFGIKNPEIIAAHTIHPAVEKAAHILGCKLRKVGVDSNTYKLDIKAMKKEINSNTVLLIGSAPDYAHGIVDDIAAVSALGEKYKIPVHVDCCLGGFCLPFMNDAGFHDIPCFDFRLNGVTSISADTHKYGNSPKGSSVLLYRNDDYRHYQYFVTPEWPGGIYASPAIAGSRAGGLVSQCWGALMSHGKKGYVDITRDIINNARNLKEGIKNIQGLKLLGNPLGPVISFTSDEIDIYCLADELQELGWHHATIQLPPGIQIFLTSLHRDPKLIDQMLEDIQKGCDKVRASPDTKPKGIGKLYCTAVQIPDKNIVADAGNLFLDGYFWLPKA